MISLTFMSLHNFAIRNSPIFCLSYQGSFLTSRIQSRRKCKSRQADDGCFNHSAEYFWTSTAEPRLFPPKCTSTCVNAPHLQRSSKSHYWCSLSCGPVQPPVSMETVNPRGSQSLQLWQTGITKYPSFGKFKNIHVSLDTFSGAIFVSVYTIVPVNIFYKLLLH